MACTIDRRIEDADGETVAARVRAGRHGDDGGKRMPKASHAVARTSRLIA